MDQLHQTHKHLEPFKAALLEHPIYREINGLAALRVFMEHHIYAVWDFMSLLKALQRQLTCVAIPWLPVEDAAGSRMVNEIVVAEESDQEGHGGFASHFDLYHRAMKRCGANTAGIDGFVSALRHGQPVSAALELPGVPACARKFVVHTFSIIDGGNLVASISAFTFGREDLLPSVFQRIVDEINVEADGGLEDFKYYLNRHIGLDGEEHGPMANRLLMSRCGTDGSAWHVARETAQDCLRVRRELWDGIHDAIRQAKVAAR